MNREFVNGATLKIGGPLVSKYNGYGDELEVVLVIKANDMFFGVLAQGRQAHRANKIERGQLVEVEGSVVSDSWPKESGGWKIAYFVRCKRLRSRKETVPDEDPLAEYPELPKFKIFEKCGDLN